MAIMAECVDVAVAATLLACVGAGHSIGNATCRTSISRLVALLVQDLLTIVAWFQVLLCGHWLLGDALLDDWRDNEANSLDYVGVVYVDV